MNLHGFHHVAYRCNDARETVDFYREHRGMAFQYGFAEDPVPSTGGYNNYVHECLNAANGNALAFLALPQSPKVVTDDNTSWWFQHIALTLVHM